MAVQPKPGAHLVRAKPRVYPPKKIIAWVEDHMAHLEPNMAIRNNQSVYGTVTMTIPSGENIFRLVFDKSAENVTIEQVVSLMPHLEGVARLYARATVLCMLDLLQG